eukprot:m.87024 g.87024  ORF g.87024 m.87024 type:complete len:210 (-) comp16382_c0_seq1:55-684(-)
MAKKKSKKGGSKKGGKKGTKKCKSTASKEEPESRSTGAAGDSASAKTTTQGAWVHVQITMAQFHKHHTLPCHFSDVFNIGTPLEHIRRLIAVRYDHTIDEIVLFDGEKVGERIKRNRSTPPIQSQGHVTDVALKPNSAKAVDEECVLLSWKDTLHDMGVEPLHRTAAEEGKPTFTLFYDYELSMLQDCPLVNLDADHTGQIHTISLLSL